MNTPLSIDRNNKLISLGITFLLAALLLLVFLFIKFITPIPPFEASPMGGLEVNFGYDEAGMGDNNSLQPIANEAKKENAASQPETNAPSEMLSSDEATNVVSPPVKNKNKEVKVEEPKPDQNLLSALNKIKNSSGSNSGDGNTNTPGNQGDENGSLNAPNYSEGGNGGKDKWRLKGSGRKMIGAIEIGNESQETGIVAVEILVDKYGKVTRATPVLVGSTTTSLYLWNKAKSGLEGKTLFNQSPSGEEARGTIYINFTLR